MESHYYLPLPARCFLNHNTTRERSTAPHSTNPDTAITMSLLTPRVVSVCHFWNHIIFYCLWRTVLCNCKWVSDDYSVLVSISSAMSWREQLTLAQIIIMYAFFQTIALKVRNVAPLWHIIPTLKQPICLCPFFLMMLA